MSSVTIYKGHCVSKWGWGFIFWQTPYQYAAPPCSVDSIISDNKFLGKQMIMSEIIIRNPSQHTYT